MDFTTLTTTNTEVVNGYQYATEVTTFMGHSDSGMYDSLLRVFSRANALYADKYTLVRITTFVGLDRHSVALNGTLPEHYSIQCVGECPIQTDKHGAYLYFLGITSNR